MKLTQKLTFLGYKVIWNVEYLLEYRNRSYIEVRRGGGFWPMGPALYRVIYLLTRVPNTVEQGKYSWNSLLGQWCWAMWPQERHLLLSACLLSACLLSVVSCLLSVVSCQLSVVKVSPFSRVENRRSDCVTPLQWTGSASLIASCSLNDCSLSILSSRRKYVSGEQRDKNLEPGTGGTGGDS